MTDDRLVVRQGKCVSHTNMVPYINGKRARPWTKIEAGVRHTLEFRPRRTAIDVLLRRPGRARPNPAFDPAAE